MPSMLSEVDSSSVPLLSLGGAEKPENLQKVKLREHLELMFQMQGQI